jgi:hypothetical protein
MTWLPFILLTISFAAYFVSQLQIFGKLKTHALSFWGEDSWERKYSAIKDAPDTWYYRFFKIKYKERFPGSATIFVALTDGYHLMQFISHLSLITAFALLTANFWLYFISIYALKFIVWFVVRKIFER